MPQSKSQETYKRAFLVLCSITLAACSSLPQKPSVELGIIDYPAGQVIVNMTGGKSFSAMRNASSFMAASYYPLAQAIVTGGQRVPLASYDRGITFKPTEWQKEINYVHSMERYIQAHCQ